MNTAQSTAV